MKNLIDRHALVTRHNPHVTKFEPFSALSVGNGEFAFTADATGLQTFPELYEKDFPLGTTAQWAWHSSPLPPALKIEDFRYENWDTYGRNVPYPTSSTGQEALYNYLRNNPHRFHLGRIGLELKHADGTKAKPEDITAINQTLDLWRGLLISRFRFDGQDVLVQTLCHPTRDCLSFRIESPLLKSGRIKIKVSFPYGSPNKSMADWNAAEKHHTKLVTTDPRGVSYQRTMTI